MTCIGNSGALDDEVAEAITNGDIVAAAVLSGNRNFEGRVHPQSRANYLASPPLCVAYALAGTVNIDFDKEPIGKNASGQDIFLKDIWPTRDEVNKLASTCIKPEMFIENYKKIAKGTDRWNSLKVSDSKTYSWRAESTYIHDPPFFKYCNKELP